MSKGTGMKDFNNYSNDEVNHIMYSIMGIDDNPKYFCHGCQQEVPYVEVTFKSNHNNTNRMGCGGTVTRIQTPDYCNDLNLWHDIEKDMDGTEASFFRDNLLNLDIIKDANMIEDWWYVHASAREKAIAFLEMKEMMK